MVRKKEACFKKMCRMDKSKIVAKIPTSLAMIVLGCLTLFLIILLLVFSGIQGNDKEKNALSIAKQEEADKTDNASVPARDDVVSAKELAFNIKNSEYYNPAKPKEFYASLPSKYLNNPIIVTGVVRPPWYARDNLSRQISIVESVERRIPREGDLDFRYITKVEIFFDILPQDINIHEGDIIFVKGTISRIYGSGHDEIPYCHGNLVDRYGKYSSCGEISTYGIDFKDCVLLKNETSGQQPNTNTKSTSRLGYTTYSNGRFGYKIDYPKEFVRKTSSSNIANIILFASPDKKAVLILKADNTEGWTLMDCYNDVIKNSVLGNSILYQIIKDNLFVVTWTMDYKGSVYKNYTKVYGGKGSFNGFVFSYPEKEKDKYDEVVTNLEKSFVPGDIDRSW